jgi:integrase/recombinase XerD
VTGCRSGEVLKLSCADVDLKHKRLVIRFGKNDKKRLVPLHASTVKALQRYERQRKNRFFRHHPETFFVSLVGTPVAYSELERGFVRVSKKIGLRGAGTKRGPRIHDLRHTFAVRTILRWYRQNLPVEAQLPILSAYLGHTKPSDTYWYLTAVPELLALAVKRLPDLRS